MKIWLPLSFLIVIFLSLFIFSVYKGSLSFSSNLNNQSGWENIYQLWENQEYMRIIDLTDKTLDEEPLNKTALLFYGFSHFYQGVFQISEEQKMFFINETIVALRKLLLTDLNNDREKVYYILGKAYLLKGSFYADLAVNYLHMSLENGYKNEDTYEYLGEAYSLLKDYEKSIGYFLKASEDYPSDALYIKLGEDCFQNGLYEKSADFYQKAINITRDESIHKKGLFQLGKLYYDIKNYSQAVQTFERLITIKPVSTEVFFLLGESYFFLDEKDNARKYWHESLKIDSRYKPALLRLYG